MFDAATSESLRQHIEDEAKEGKELEEALVAVEEAKDAEAALKGRSSAFTEEPVPVTPSLADGVAEEVKDTEATLKGGGSASPEEPVPVTPSLADGVAEEVKDTEATLKGGGSASPEEPVPVTPSLADGVVVGARVLVKEGTYKVRGYRANEYEGIVVEILENGFVSVTPMVSSRKTRRRESGTDVKLPSISGLGEVSARGGDGGVSVAVKIQLQAKDAELRQLRHQVFISEEKAVEERQAKRAAETRQEAPEAAVQGLMRGGS